jgi:hypothetical protein
MQNEKLKPCPFCGGQAASYGTDFSNFVECCRCMAATKRFTLASSAILVWNCGAKDGASNE